ncbi:MAG TPA: 30S ribosomal protein S8 [Candidatus Omnitrophica bacterium]|nr:MAG: 30S ribosomal protein S8 [Omnitrophica WOR_2 bacterium GWA2_63_20]OGX16769.1 MAG: 30S ribosomal protein S8 [Omnitrophica WOR_2 bacterium GWF2_63_9]OGX32187.1 MAG: 30S ribosomal protein S8 [Omnitrophica WOR_2 bacterium RIFCSPHIGHO2_12_FULL_64_13]OGX36673.1 MAG: 30S ribosomal protein S8 [Omnitrophica WOR_2 bacterium RIFCSPHIGHO2_02_FULL_63_39]OGX45025.1 MAG: 30S ribosomal protein S8 [Omnitrophica WOR_2 bacterium RIFCSPLOWO2_02_FULL_63_16]OGX49993.1 MAG: 30S ribosomal protein S8 [Omnitrop
MAAVDPIANGLTKVRNASRARLPSVDVSASRMMQRLLALLKEEGFIKAFKPVGQPPHQQIRVYLKYGAGKLPAIVQMVRVSRGGQRRYATAQKLPRVLRGLGRAIVSTSQGLMTDSQARRQHLGGEVMAYVW